MGTRVIYMRHTVDYIHSLGKTISVENQTVNWRDTYVVLTDINADNNGG